MVRTVRRSCGNGVLVVLVRVVKRGVGGACGGGRTKKRTIQVSITVRWAGRMEKADMF